MKRLILFLFLVCLQCTPQVFAQNNPNQNAKKPATGDIDMHQFDDINPPNGQRRPAEKNVRIQTTCTDDEGRIIKRTDPGFATCLSNAQSRLLNQSANPEAPDDARKR